LAEKWTYAKAGVDVKKAGRAHKEIGELVEETFKLRTGRFGEVTSRFGHYASLVRIGGGRLLALHADGVGSKVLIAQLMDRYDTVGIDCVAMNVNDLICVGAEPVGIVDYLAVERVNEEVVKAIMRGLVSGAKEAGVAILGGETAVLPDIIRGAVEGRGFDLAATSIGMVDEDKVILGDRVAEGDAVVGLVSNGVHSNGLTLARRVLIGEKLEMVHEKLPGFDRSVGEELLVPTRIYVRAVRELLRSLDVHGLAHITGGSFGKLRRLGEYSRTGFQLDSMPDPQPLFKEIQRRGRVSDKEMYGTFNMGVGLCVVVDRESAEDAVGVCEKAGFGASVVGKVVQESGVKVRPPKGRRVSLR